jgi:hypothetical protein
VLKKELPWAGFVGKFVVVVYGFADFGGEL